MSEFPSYLIVGWVVAMVAAFPSFTPRRGMLVILLSGWLFLPEAVRGVVELGPLKFGKLQAISYALLLAALLYDPDRLFALTPRRADLPALVWCGCPVASALLNDPPPDGSGAVRDAVSSGLAQCTIYLVPYLIGRIYFADPEGLRELAGGAVVGGLVYVPLCLYEARMAPVLHATVYGYAQHDFLQTLRFGGYRPMVFLQHGLMVGMFLAAATVLAAFGRRSGPTAVGWGRWAVGVLGVTTVACKSTGAAVLGAVGLGVYLLARRGAARWALLALLAAPPAYCVARVTGLWSGAELVDAAWSNIDAERAGSLNFRLEHENHLIGRAMERPVFGWGGWGRNRLVSREGRDASVTDGLWVIVLGTSGVVGLTALGAMLLLPAWRYAVWTPAAEWAGPTHAAAAGCAIVVGLWTVDSLFNAMLSPVYLVMAAGLTGLPLDAGPAGSVEGPAAGQPPQVAGDHAG